MYQRQGHSIDVGFDIVGGSSSGTIGDTRSDSSNASVTGICGVCDNIIVGNSGSGNSSGSSSGAVDGRDRK